MSNPNQLTNPRDYLCTFCAKEGCLSILGNHTLRQRHERITLCDCKCQHPTITWQYMQNPQLMQNVITRTDGVGAEVTFLIGRHPRRHRKPETGEQENEKQEGD